jgi:hypothetical protein
MIPALLFTLSLITLGVSHAQTPVASPKQALTFRTLGADCAPDGLNYLSGSNAVALSVQQGVRSLPQTYTGGSPMVLFRIATGKDGKPVQIPIASVDVSQAGTYPLLVFLKGPKGPEQPIVQVLREDAKSFPAGVYRAINDTTNALTLTFGSVPLPVPPLSVRDHKAEAEILTVGITAQEGTVPYQALRANIGMLPDKRTLILAIPPSSPGGHVQIQRHTDGVPAQ